MRIKDTYIIPFTDFGFRKLFGSESNKFILIDFLNELLSKETGSIVDLTYLDRELLGYRWKDRKAVIDFCCESETGEKFIVEMQKAKHRYFKDRRSYFSSFRIPSRAEKGEWPRMMDQLNAVYTIGILDFVFDVDKYDTEVYHHEVQLFDKSNNEFFYDKLTHIYLSLPKFTKTEEQLETHFDKWLYVLKNLGDLTRRPAKLQERVFCKLFEQAEIARYSDDEYQEYEGSLKVYRDLKNSFDTAREEGREEARKERKKDFALMMLQDSEDLEKIARYTGLSVERIEELKKRLGES